MMDPIKDFQNECSERIHGYATNKDLLAARDAFMDASTKAKYSYNFSWLGRPIIQYPQDIIAMQEIIWRIKPDLIIETGVAHGGSVIFYASMLELVGNDGIVIGIDIDIRKHNRAEIEKHKFAKRIELIEGSSVDSDTFDKVKSIAKDRKNVLVVLDSNHTHEHVLQELFLYAPLVTKGNYCVVFDTIVEDVAPDTYPDRPWGRGNNPMTAVHEFLKIHKEFVLDKEIDNKLLISVAPDGFLRRVE
jgi:cephalosporin hydroxylase